MTDLAELSDQNLILLVQATGDSAAFSQLVKRHQQAFQGFLFRFTGNKALSEDLTQNAFIKSYEKIANFKQDASFKTWLFSIGYREFLQYKRKSSAMDRMLQALRFTNTTEDTTDLNLNIDLEKGLMNLSVNERAAILLCDAYGMSHAEASTAMGAPLGSVKTYVRRARLLMNNSMVDHDES